jgi:hypothetical protein
MGSSNTQTLQQTITWAQLNLGNLPLAVQNTAEPALTHANTIIQAFDSPPFKWRWNRGFTTFFTADPLGWQPNTTYTTGYRIVDSNGNLETVTTPGTSGATQPSWPFSLGTSTSDNTVTWTNSFVSDLQESIPDFGYIEKAAVQAQRGPNAMSWYEIPNVGEGLLTLDFGTGRPKTLYPFADDNNGNITFRTMPGMPDQLYLVHVNYQKRMTLLSALNSVWPIPDMYSQVYKTGFLGMCYLYADDQKAAFFLQRFAAQLISISDGLTETQKNSFMQEWDVFVNSARAAAKATQGIGARAAS